MALRVASWTGDHVLLELMRQYVQAANRLNYAERKTAVDDVDYHAQRRAREDAAAALEDALMERGWTVPGRVPSPRPTVQVV